MATSTVGGAMSGNWAVGRVMIPSPPRNRRRIEITIANAGRWRIFANMLCPRAGGPSLGVVLQLGQHDVRGAILGLDLLAVTDLSDPVENYLVGHVHPLLDDEDVILLVRDDDLSLV